MEQIAISWEPVRRTFTVSELSNELRGILNQHFTDIWVSGEISGTRLPASGHYYFTLKDQTSQLRCVCYKMTAPDTLRNSSLKTGLRCWPEDGWTFTTHAAECNW